MVVHELLQLGSGMICARLVVPPVLLSHGRQRIRSTYAVAHENPLRSLDEHVHSFGLMTLAALGKRLKRWREAAGYSQEQLADLLESDQASISRWERGLSLPSIRAAILLARLSQGDIPVESWADLKRTA